LAEISEFQHGFFGASGEGAGKHLPVAQDNIDAIVINRIENAIVMLESKFNSEGHFGSFQLEESYDNPIIEYFNGDGTTTGFTLRFGITKYQIEDYDITLSDPYANGIFPENLGGQLVNFDSETNLTKSIRFSTAPASGIKNVKVSYSLFRRLGSQVNSGAYLNDWMD